MACKHKCQYKRPIVANGSIKMCHYLLDIGHSRGCDVEDCTHYLDAKIERKRSCITIMPSVENQYTWIKGGGR